MNDGNKPFPKGDTSLTARFANYIIAKIVATLDRGASVNERQNSAGVTPIFIAIEAKNIGVLKLLIDRGADVNAATDAAYLSEAPMHMAAVKNFASGIALLAKNGGRLEQLNLYSYTPLSVAAGFGNTEALGMLISLGANLNARNISGKTPVMVATMNGHVAAVRALVAAGADRDIRNNDGLTAMDEVAKLPQLSEDIRAGLLAALAAPKRVPNAGVAMTSCADIGPVARQLQAANPKASPAVLLEALRNYQVLRGCIAPPQKSECSWVGSTWTCTSR